MKSRSRVVAAVLVALAVFARLRVVSAEISSRSS
jgi:hypothetical protein